MGLKENKALQKRIVVRLKKRADFLTAASGRRFYSKCFSVQGVSREADGDGLRLGLTVTKRVGTAVERNRIKRRLRPACEQALFQFGDMDIDIVIIARRSILDIDYADLIIELAKAVSVIGQSKGENKKYSSFKE